MAALTAALAGSTKSADLLQGINSSIRPLLALSCQRKPIILEFYGRKWLIITFSLLLNKRVDDS